MQCGFSDFATSFPSTTTQGPLYGPLGLGDIVALSAPQLSAAIVCSGCSDMLLICARKSLEAPGICGAPEHAGEFIRDLMLRKTGALRLDHCAADRPGGFYHSPMHCHNVGTSEVGRSSLQLTVIRVILHGKHGCRIRCAMHRAECVLVCHAFCPHLGAFLLSLMALAFHTCAGGCIVSRLQIA